MLKRISSFVTFLVLFLVIYYLFKNRGDFKSLAIINPLYIILIFILRIIQLSISGLFIKITTDFFLEERTMSIYESFYISGISAVGNFFSFFQGGVAIRAVYLKTKFNFGYIEFASTAAINYIILFAIFGSFGLVGAMMLEDVPIIFFLILFGLSFVGLIILPIWDGFFKFYKTRFNYAKINTFFNKIDIIMKGVKRMIFNYNVSVRLLLLFIARFLLALIINFLILKSVSVSISFPALLLYTSIAGLSIIINITPAAIGVREIVFVIISAALVMTENQIVEGAIVDRTILFLVLIFYYFIFKLPFFKKKYNLETPNNCQTQTE